MGSFTFYSRIKTVLDAFKMLKLFGSGNRSLMRERVQALLVFLFIFPLFFQLSGSLFIAEDGFNYDSQGKLLLLPLPIASIFCFLAIAILLRLEKNHFGIGFVFSVFVLSLLATMVSTGGTIEADLWQAKFILLIQFLLPLFGLVLGSLYLSPKSEYARFEALALYMLMIVIPLEIISTITRGTGILSPYAYFFGLYQHLQYLPVVFVSLYFLTVTALYENKKLRYLILFLAPWMGIYISASLSMLAIILAVVASFIAFWFLNKNEKRSYVILVVLLLWGSFSIYYPITQATGTYALKYSHDLQAKKTQQGEASNQEKSYKDSVMAILPNNLKERFPYWEFYMEGVIESPKTFLFGHQTRPDRGKYPSAHNYYLDLIYHFGVISLLPFIYLILLTIRSSWQAIITGMITPSLAMFIIVVGFFVFADNFLKVSFRQPYPGMMMFFIWGVLLTKLSMVQNSNKGRNG